jgi:hypothetical protein
MDRALSTNGEKGNAYRFLLGKPEERSLGRPRREWADNIVIDLRAIGLDSMVGLDSCVSK